MAVSGGKTIPRFMNVDRPQGMALQAINNIVNIINEGTPAEIEYLFDGLVYNVTLTYIINYFITNYNLWGELLKVRINYEELTILPVTVTGTPTLYTF